MPVSTAQIHALDRARSVAGHGPLLALAGVRALASGGKPAAGPL